MRFVLRLSGKNFKMYKYQNKIIWCLNPDVLFSFSKQLFPHKSTAFFRKCTRPILLPYKATVIQLQLMTKTLELYIEHDAKPFNYLEA